MLRYKLLYNASLLQKAELLPQAHVTTLSTRTCIKRFVHKTRNIIHFILRIIRFQLFSICHHIDETISSTYIVLPFISCQTLPSHLRCTLLTSSCKFFSCTTLSIVVAPSLLLFNKAWLMIVLCTAFNMHKSFHEFIWFCYNF